jgi:hypothetical protein
MIPDPYKKTLRIPVRLKDGHFQLFHGGPLPKIKVGAIADLVIESHYFENPADVDRMEVHKTVTFGKKGDILMARLSTDYCESTQGLTEDIKIDPQLGYPVAFVPIQLKETLELTLVFGKSAHLNDCPCILPSINNLDARSINHAFTLASRHYETRRRSNGGNVFLSVYFEDGKIWRPLKDLRFKHEAEFETEIARRNGELGL